MQEVYRSVRVDLQQVHPLETQDWVHPGGEVIQEGVHTTAGPLLCGQRSAVLPRDTEPLRQCFDEITGDLAGPKHLPHQPRWPRGVRVNHSGRGVRCMSAGSVTISHKAYAWVGNPFRETAPRRGTKVKSASGAKRHNSRVFDFPCIFGTPKSTLFRIFEGLTIFHQRGLKIQAMLGIIRCYGLVENSMKKRITQSVRLFVYRNVTQIVLLFVRCLTFVYKNVT